MNGSRKAVSVSIHFRCETDGFQDGAGGAFEISRILKTCSRILEHDGLPSQPFLIREGKGNVVGQMTVHTVREKGT